MFLRSCAIHRTDNAHRRDESRSYAFLRLISAKNELHPYPNMIVDIRSV